MSRAMRPYTTARVWGLTPRVVISRPMSYGWRMRGHVVYESRLELARLIFADFDRSVHRILAQPFLLKAKVDGKIRKHVPDYFLVADHGPVVIDVKPEHLLAKQTVAYTFAWTRRLVEARAWKYEVWSGAPAPELENLRFLAGFRRPWLFDASLLDQVRGSDVEGRTFGEVVRGLDGRDPAAARASSAGRVSVPGAGTRSTCRPEGRVPASSAAMTAGTFISVSAIRRKATFSRRGVWRCVRD
jgi:hypothetical protein